MSALYAVVHQQRKAIVDRTARIDGVTVQRVVTRTIPRPICAAMEQAEEWLQPLRQAATIADRLDAYRQMGATK